MAPHVGKVARLVETSVSQPKDAAQPPTPPLAAQNVQASADYRLVIEQDPETGTFIYRTLDRRTGEVVQQLPREELLRWRRDPAYVAGNLIDAKA